VEEVGRKGVRGSTVDDVSGHEYRFKNSLFLYCLFYCR
jgi:hypothetical protein